MDKESLSRNTFVSDDFTYNKTEILSVHIDRKKLATNSIVITHFSKHARRLSRLNLDTDSKSMTKRSNKKINSTPPDIPASPSTPTPPPTAADSRMLRRPLLIASLGNPPPQYRNTLHSAGHTLLTTLQQTLSHPPFTKSRPHANGLLSRGDAFTLWQSPTLMNVSGPAVATAWKTFLRDLPHEQRARAKLVILHDELESPLGKIKTKVGGSARGHNGLKSCVGSLGGMAFTRVGVGIGRPESRESGDVASYVLRKMSGGELRKVEEGVDDLVDILTKMLEE
ncbi:peptidyl-tRNA hydrolase [Usnea florida]